MGTLLAYFDTNVFDHIQKRIDFTDSDLDSLYSAVQSKKLSVVFSFLTLIHLIRTWDFATIAQVLPLQVESYGKSVERQVDTAASGRGHFPCIHRQATLVREQFAMGNILYCIGHLIVGRCNVERHSMATMGSWWYRMHSALDHRQQRNIKASLKNSSVRIVCSLGRFRVTRPLQITSPHRTVKAKDSHDSTQSTSGYS